MILGTRFVPLPDPAKVVFIGEQGYRKYQIL